MTTGRLKFEMNYYMPHKSQLVPVIILIYSIVKTFAESLIAIALYCFKAVY